jgi:hypothetical protein
MTFDCILHPLSWFCTGWLFVMAQEAEVIGAKEQMGVKIGEIAGIWPVLVYS